MVAPTNPDVVDIRQPVRILLRNLWVPILVALVVGALAYYNAARQDDVYAASAVVQVQDPTLGSTLQRDRIDPVRAVQIQVLYAQSRRVLDAVRDRLGDNVGSVKFHAAAMSSADAIRLSADSGRPATAQRAAKTYAEVYMEQRRAALANPLAAQAERLRAQAVVLQPQLQDLDRRITEETPPSTTRAVETPVLRGLITDRAALADRIAGLNTQASQLDLEASVRVSQFEIVDPPDLPESPVRPAPLRDGAVGLTLGLILGACLAFPLDRRRDLIWTSDDIETLALGIPLLGIVPRRRFRRRRAAVSFDGPGLDPAAEAYRLLRANLLFGHTDRTIQTVLVTGPNAKDGKTTVAINLAISLAQGGSSVTVVDTDLRSPSIHEVLGLSEEPGLTSVLSGEVPLSDAVLDVDMGGNGQRVGSLSVLPSGPPTSAPGEALLHPATPNTIAELRDTHQYVILDGPPVLAAADSLNLAWLVDGVVIVVGAGRSRRKDLRATAYRLQQVDAPILGLVLNGGRLGQESRGYSGYGPTSERVPRPAPTVSGARVARRSGPAVPVTARSKR
jgi:capsular exopolysaccharide synthesis family protein